MLYAVEPSAHQQGIGFSRDLAWDVALYDGFRQRTLRPSRAGETLSSDHFFGLDVPEVARALVELRPDVALVPGWHSVTLVRALWACHRNRIPVLYRGESHLLQQRSLAVRLARQVRTRSMLRLYSGYLSIGRHARTYLRHFGVSKSRIWDAPYTVDNEYFAAAARPFQTPAARAAARQRIGLGADRFVLLSCAKLMAIKRPQDLIRAAAQLRPAPQLLVVGSGEEENRCRQLAAELHVDVVWAGLRNQSELGELYAVSDCLVLPSERETWGLVVNEAMATGLPCVVSDAVGCAPDLITRDTGEVHHSGDPQDLAAAIERVRARTGTGHRYDEACRRHIALYSFATASRGLIDACRGVAR